MADRISSTSGALNLTHREDHAELQPLEPGRRGRVRIELLPVAQAFVPGHRLRIAISPTDWRFWPSPEPVTLALHLGAGTSLQLPVRRPSPDDDALPAFGPAEESAVAPYRLFGRGPLPERLVSEVVSERRTTVHEGYENIGRHLRELRRTGHRAAAIRTDRDRRRGRAPGNRAPGDRLDLVEPGRLGSEDRDRDGHDEHGRRVPRIERPDGLRGPAARLRLVA